jgi:hypothetical protein
VCQNKDCSKINLNSDSKKIVPDKNRFGSLFMEETDFLSELGIKEKARRNELLLKIGKLIEEFEDPTGHDCSNNVGMEISFEYDTEKYRYSFEYVCCGGRDFQLVKILKRKHPNGVRRRNDKKLVKLVE